MAHATFGSPAATSMTEVRAIALSGVSMEPEGNDLTTHALWIPQRDKSVTLISAGDNKT